MKTVQDKNSIASMIHLPGLVSPHDLSTDRQFSMNLARGLEVLRAFTPLDAVLGNRDISDRTGLPRPTISRLTYTLTLLGYLSYDERLQKYRLGSGVLSLGYPLLASMRIRQIARPFMEHLSKDTGCTVNLGMRDRSNIVYVETCRLDAGNAYQPDIGSTRPLLSTAMGRALLMACSTTDCNAILNRLQVMDPGSFAKDKPSWDRDKKAFSRRHFCHSQGDWREEIHAIAAPIRQPHNEPQVALNCTMSAIRLSKNSLEEEAAPRMLEAIRQIEGACGIH
ncbi:IclR family transcriptional regulator [Allopusillimonas soli]